jgi:hypothetical protein
MFDFDPIKRSIKRLQERLAEIDTQIQELQRKRNAVLSAPAARVDIKAMLAKWIDATAGKFAPLLGAYLNDYIRRPGSIPTALQLQDLLSLSKTDMLTGDMSANQLEAVLCACFGSQLKEAFTRAVDAMDWPTEGLPLSERQAYIAEVDQQLEALYREQGELRERAAEAGLVV